MSGGVIGAIIGLIVGIIDMFVLRKSIAGREVTSQTRIIINIVSYLSLVIFPIVGWYAGATMTGAQ
jgi:hypothetical protein